VRQQHAIARFGCLVSASSDKRANLRLARVLAVNGPSVHKRSSCYKEEVAQPSRWTLTRKSARAIPWCSAAALRHLSMAIWRAPRLVAQHHGIAEPINNTLLEH